MVKNSLFMGSFHEKRLVESLNSYRDVITISPDEEDFIKNLMAVKKKIDKDWLKKTWVGITEPNTVGAPVGYNLWVELREEIFGKYWFKVKNIEFLENEIRMKLDIIRPVKDEYSLNNASNESAENDQSIDVQALLKEVGRNVKQNLICFYKNILTFKNTKETVIFTSLLLATIVAGAFNMIQYGLEYLLRLIKELSGFIKAASPIIIAFINCIGRFGSGMFSMILGICKRNPVPQPVYNAYVNYDPYQNQFQDPRLRYNQHFARALPYYPKQRRSGVQITPLDN
ncbi:hypothetical protein NQ317_014411 [Molorchus minor]|uniref:Uncharacterized protein n=1 Tax=Molorchus minor TaxID=1323400 RepID=A0ABQ9K5B5_9CUCU|nr:hypothetical protein NQ317_014411 [Molorchus minor]